MHEAYEISRLLTLKDQIEAITAYDDHVLLGTRLGHLIMYSLNLNTTTQKYDVQLEYYCKTFSKKPIQQIEIIPEDNLLLCLTDNMLAAYDVKGPNFPLKTAFEKTKGASLFAVNEVKSTVSLTGESNSIVHLCVAVKRKLQLYFGKNGEFKEHNVEFTVTDIPRVIAWGQQYLWVGYKAEYTLFDLGTGNPKELFPTSSNRSLEPTITKFTDTSFLLGRDDTLVLVEEGNVDFKKPISPITTIKWNTTAAREAPIAVVWDDYYILGLLPSDEVIVQTVEPKLFIQTLPELNKARLMYRYKRGLIFVASVGQLWCLSAVDIEVQRKQLLNDKQFQVAIDLTNLSDLQEEEKKQTVHQIRKLRAYDYFNNKEYVNAMNEFIELDTDPTDVIKLFPELNCKPAEAGGSRSLGKDVESALNALIGYLTHLRTSTGTTGEVLGRNVDQQLELIDTTLLKCYLQTNDAFIAPLLRINNCRLDEAERVLLQHGKYSELIILYQMKGQHTKALQLLKEQSNEQDSPLKGYQRTKNYLQQLGADHLNLIFKFSDWILEKYPEEGLKIFTEDLAEVENLPRANVLDFLLREHEPLVIPYLEHIIHTWNDTTPSFHDALITKYREKITDKKAYSTEEELKHTKSKLIAFLEVSSCYTPERMILHFPTDSLYQERAIILGKLGRHEQSLAIYVQILGDVDKAITYCEKINEKNKDKHQDVYVTLMRILMNPDQSSALTGPLANVQRHPKTSVPDLESTLLILEKHADKISPLKALSVLPDSVPLARLKHFLESALDSQLTLKRKTQILKGLLYAENIQVQELKRFNQSKSVVINDYTVCPVCKKRFGNQSAFVRYPNGDIVHYSCGIDK